VPDGAKPTRKLSETLDQPLDVDGQAVLASLDDIDWSIEVDGQIVRDQLCATVVRNRKTWADVVILFREWERGAWLPDPMGYLTRWKYERKAWRLFDCYRLGQAALVPLAEQLAGIVASARAEAGRRTQGRIEDNRPQYSQQILSRHRRGSPVTLLKNPPRSADV
jgi:hypothetical protein